LSSLAAADRIVGRRDYGGVLIVRADLGGLWAEFLVDTGSAVTSLTPRAVERLRLDRNRFTGRRVVFTAAGTSMAVPTGRIPSLRLGSVELRNVEVALLDLPAGVHVDGLLGVNVLDRFRATFEFRRATLVLRPDPAR
jgi:clan AA aspartic protease (TIGR02281 family)